MTQTTAQKHDVGKIRFDLLPSSIVEVMRCATIGAQKYTAHNWKEGFPYSRVFNAMMRHLFAFWYHGENLDQEEFHHLAAVAYMCLWLMEYQRQGSGTDDRPIPPFEDFGAM